MFDIRKLESLGLFGHWNLMNSMGGSPVDVGEMPVTWMKRRRKDWRMSCDVNEATEGLANEILHSSTLPT